MSNRAAVMRIDPAMLGALLGLPPLIRAAGVVTENENQPDGSFLLLLEGDGLPSEAYVKDVTAPYCEVSAVFSLHNGVRHCFDHWDVTCPTCGNTIRVK